jgi:hypothetical protein
MRIPSPQRQTQSVTDRCLRLRGRLIEFAGALRGKLNDLGP